MLAPAIPLFASFALPAVAAVAVVAAVGVPVLVHLLFRQRLRVVDWAAMRFLVAATVNRRRRIDHWPLLVARIFALLLPLLAMCAAMPWAERAWQSIRPGDPETTANAPRTHHVLVVDATASMTAKAGEATRFESAVALAEKAIRAANAGDAFSLIVLAGAPQPVVPGPSNAADAVIDELHNLKPTHGSADAAAGLAMIADTLARSPKAYLRRQVLVFTDVQRSAWSGLLPKPDAPPPEIWAKITARADVGIIDVSGGDLDNLAVTDLSLVDPLPLVDDPTVVTAAVQNFGRSDKRQVRVELLLARPGASGPPLTLEQRVIDAIPAGGRAAVSFVLDGERRFRQPGIHVLQLRLVEADDLPADDVRSLAVEVREGLNALIVNGRTGRESLYLAEALAPGGQISPGNPARPRVVTPDAFADATLSDLSAVDAVFLCDVPTLTPSQLARLDAVLKRGGGVVLSLGPTAAMNAEACNRLTFADGTPLLPGKILGATDVPARDSPGIRLAAGDDAFRRPPLAAFQDDNARAGLTGVPFRRYVKLDASAEGLGRRILSFVPAGVTEVPAKPDAALIEVPRHRGRLVIFTSTFHAEWTDWPVLPSYLPFAHELLRFAAANPGRRTGRVGDPIQEGLPATVVGQRATLTGPDETTATATIGPAEEGGVVTFADTRLAGLYRLAVPGLPARPFAINVPETSLGGGSESDLRRVDPLEFQSIHPSVQVVTDPAALKLLSADAGTVVTTPRPHGPTVARYLATIGLIALVVELILAWRFGPARSSTVGDAGEPLPPRLPDRLGSLFGLALVLIAAAALFAVAHAAVGGEFLGFLPETWRANLEAAAGVPKAGPGEGTRWRLETSTIFARTLRTDHLVLLGLAAALFAGATALYSVERRVAGGWRRLFIPIALRVAVYFSVLFLVLPQPRLAFDREGFPDIAILIDTSASMATVDDFRDDAVRAKAEQLLGGPGDRLRLAKRLLKRSDADWVARLLTEKQVKVHIYSVAEQATLLATVNESGDLEAASVAIDAVTSTGPGSRLGDAVEGVVKSFRGGSLAAVIVLTDGVTTAGDNLPTAGRLAARAGVPLYLVGVGDAIEPLDLAIGDVRADDVVAKGDDLVLEARLTARGGTVPKTVTITLAEKVGDALITRDRVTVTPDAAGTPVPFRLKHATQEAGEKTFVISVPVQAGEPEAANNSLSRVVTVTTGKALRVLYIEAYPRYEFRFLKVLLERETDGAKGPKAIEFRTLLLDASKDHATTDRTALRAFPTRAELFEYDVVILGDVDPAKFQRPAQTCQNLVEFVVQKGGGLLVLAGEQAVPHKLFDTPLATVLPIAPSPDGPPRPTAENAPLTDGFRFSLTPAGRAHPLLRFSTDETASARTWERLQPFLWSATNYTRKPTAEVLAVHPTRPADGLPGELHPLILQQFAGAGRVMFFGFDETWRWRFRRDEELYNTFWRQAVRVLARSRVARIEVKTDKQTAYRRDEPIVLTVKFPDDAPAPTGNVRLAVERGPLVDAAGRIVGGDSESQSLALTKVEGSRATYQGVLTRTPEGDYAFRLAEPGGGAGRRPQAEAKVLPPPGETDRLEMNAADLKRAAAESRGKFYTLADSDALIDDLPEVARPPLNQPCPPVPLWNQPLLFALLLLMLGCEWVLRKRARLV